MEELLPYINRLELINPNTVTHQALQFAIKAHSGQVRKREPHLPMVIHPISVANILRDYGCDDNVIAAGYLHDVVEDTSYTLEDIRKEFGEDIEHLVEVATEPDKSLEWEERKQHTIDTVKNLSTREKLVIMADKINNIEEIRDAMKKEGKKDFSIFKRGEKEQEWYYRNIYKSLANQEDENNPLLVRLKSAIEEVF
ncbi:HD domain-containing protein [bacterium]|nr:HD domain-containing protein [bacterium]